RLALRGFSFQGRPLELLSAMSGIEAKELIRTKQDIALALVDVVMETENAGLELVKYIREECRNKIIRLVLRTGQAGQAPEDTVIQ
ncbi:response regulator, partial [Vibrio anguillarum]|nr:phosphodiesterase [Vibrio anguillarum]